MISSTLHHQLPSLFVTKVVFGLRESTLLNTITVKMSVFWGCQHGVYAMSFAASVTSYHIYYVMKRFTSVIYSDDSLIRTRLFPVDISGLTSCPDY